ncbi:MAG: endonuclease III [Dehalococcoidia bacterium]
MKTAEINRLLAGRYGNREWHQHHDPLSELIAVILSQNTSDANSQRAFDSLTRKFGNWEEVAGADVAKIEDAIRSGGLSHVKAARIKEILQTILAERGSLDLSFLENMPTVEAKEWLGKLPGVGPKTVSCVLLFALGKPVFPVDTHVFRVAKRLGLLSNGISANQAHEVMAKTVSPEDVYQLHMNMVEHGRRVCRAQRPKCSECTLKNICPSASY